MTGDRGARVKKGTSPQPGQLHLFVAAEQAPETPVAETPVAETPVAETPVMSGADASTSSTPPASKAGAVAMARAPVAKTVRSARQEMVRRVSPSPAVTLDEAIPAYLDFLVSLNRSEHTRKSFELDLRLLRGQFGNRAVGSIDTGHLRQFIAWVRVSRDNSPNSLRRKVATLKNFFGYLRDEGYLPSSPADALPYPEIYVALPEFLEGDAALRLAEAAEGNPFWYALVVLMLDTGLKRDEALALRVADVQVTDGAAGVSPGYLVVRETDAAKRLRSRRLPLTERLRDALRAYYAAVPRREGEDRVFDVSIRGINFIVEVCGQRADVVTSKPRLTPQVLRETFAVTQMRARAEEERRCLARGWNNEQLQLLTLRHDAEVLELLGLKEDPDTARKYRQLIRE